MTSSDASSGATADASMTILVYSDDVNVRRAVMLAVGRRPAPDLPRVEYLECATPAAVLSALDAGGVDVCVLDGEAVPAGGLGICRQIKDEIYQCPPVLVLIGRLQDGWLASWARAEATVAHPLDPIAVANAVAQLMRQRIAQLAVARSAS
jgi:DNA-binding response OmpR family regulator